MDNEIIEFTGKVQKKVFSSENYKVYSVDVERTNSDVKRNDYGSVTIVGDLGELDIGSEYMFTATEEPSKYGYNYKVSNLKRNKPTDFITTFEFLSNILTYNQAKALFDIYPNIIDLVIDKKVEQIDFKKLKGITKNNFKRIENKIIENFVLIDLVAEFKGYISISVIKKLYAKYKMIEKVREELIKDPYYCFCSLNGIGFKSADDILLKLQNNKIVDFGYDLLTSSQRCKSCIMFTLDENEANGNTKIDIVDLRKTCSILANECLDEFTNCIKDSEYIYYKRVGDKMFVSKNNTYKIEKYICDKVNESLLISGDNWNLKSTKFKAIEGVELSEDQIKVIDYVSDNRITLLTGYAGSGKSYSTIALINAIKNADKDYMLLAPTGKAAKVISKYTGCPASTIHRALGFEPPDKTFFNEERKFNIDLIIIDEFSMVDIFLMKKLISAIDFERTHLLLIGDHAQLPSVSCGNILHDFINSNKIPNISLTKIFRYGEGGLMKVATDIRNSETYLNSLNGIATSFGTGDYVFVNVNQDDSIKQLLALYNKLLTTNNVEDIMVITAYKKGDYGSLKLNSYLQKIANKKQVEGNNYILSGERKFYVNDMVIQTVNDYKVIQYEEQTDFEKEYQINRDPIQVFVANGEVGVIESIDYNECIINFDGIRCIYPKNKLLNIELAYAMTIHKSQGSGSKVVILFNPNAHTYMLTSNLAYVGVTRTKAICYHISTKEVIDRAIKKKDNLIRDTWTQYMLSIKGKEDE